MKLFVTDIDDTLSVGEEVSGEVRRACARLKDGGWDIMIATGRTFATAKRHMRAASATQPAILYDGARVMTLEGEEVCSTLFDNALARRLLDYLWPLPLEIQITGDEVIYCRESDADTVRFYRQAGVPIHYVRAPFATGSIYRIGLWVKPQNLPSVESEIEKHFGDDAEVAAGGPEFLDVLPKGVSKGRALERFVSGLPERPEIVVAAGDHNNDLTMLRYADVAAVPGNASPRLLPEADIVMPNAPDHGISVLVSHILSPAFSAPNRKGTPLRLPAAVRSV